MILAFVESNTTGSGILALTTAADLGFDPVLVTGNPDRYPGLDGTGACVVVCDTGSPRTVTDTLRTLGDIAGVTTTSEFYTHTVALVASELGLPGNPPDAVATCRHKGRMRWALAAAALPGPGFALVEPDIDVERQVRHALSGIALPCVVKPVDDTGSSGVLLCASAEQVVAHCQAILSARTNIRGQRSAATAIIESYLDGPEFSIEMLSASGTHECVGVTAKRVTPPPYFVEYRHVFPAPLPPRTAELLIDTAGRALTAVGVRSGVTHVEVKLVDGISYVVEINPRPAGGMIPEVIARSCGFDLLGAHLHAAVGLAPPPLPTRCTPAGIAFLLPDSEARSSYDRLGYVIATAPDHARLAEALDRALDGLRPAGAGMGAR